MVQATNTDTLVLVPSGISRSKMSSPSTLATFSTAGQLRQTLHSVTYSVVKTIALTSSRLPYKTVI
jgi:hypothetical protein